MEKFIRENGYYWVCVNDTKDWVICEYYNGKWEDTLDISEIKEIDENRIIRKSFNLNKN